MINGKKVAALCVAKISDSSSHELIVALNKRLSEENINLFVYATMSDLYWNIPEEDGEVTVFDIIDYKNTDVIIIYDEKIRSKLVVKDIIEKAKRNNIPVIIFGDKYDGCASVCYDYDRGFETVARHIIETHRPKRPYHIAGIKGESGSEKRVGIYKKVIEENGYTFCEDMVSYGEYWSTPTIAAIDELFERGGDFPDAIICANDLMAITVCGELAKRGVCVPDDVIVSGFDGILEINFNKPSITSSHCSSDDAALVITDIMKKAFSGEKYDISILVTPQTKASESCGCAKEELNVMSGYLMRLNENLIRFITDSRTLSEISTGFQFSETFEEAISHLSIHTVYDMDFIIDKVCADEKIDPTECKNQRLGETLCNLFSADHPDRMPFDFDSKEIVPDLPEIMKRNMPIIFIALNYADVPLGYTCIHFNNYDIANYLRLPQIVTAINTAITGYRSMRYQRYLTKKIEGMYKIDALTGLYNRNGFVRDYEKARIKGRFSDRITAVLLDLDGLKEINDEFGHIEGDNAIKTASVALRRELDEGAMAVRFGGDEMLAVFDGEYDCDKIKTSIETYLDAYNLTSGKPYKVSASIGCQISDAFEKIDFDELLKTTDKLMYLDKARKKKRRK